MSKMRSVLQSESAVLCGVLCGVGVPGHGGLIAGHSHRVPCILPVDTSLQHSSRILLCPCPQTAYLQNLSLFYNAQVTTILNVRIITLFNVNRKSN